MVTREYVTRQEANRWAKIREGSSIWHRMGDAGYFDESGRFWFCGRLAHRVLTAQGPMYSVPCEAIFNQHPRIFRSALVGLGPPGHQRPVIVLEPHAGQMPRGGPQATQLLAEIRRGPRPTVGGSYRRFPAPSGLSRGYPPQRQDFSRKISRGRPRSSLVPPSLLGRLGLHYRKGAAAAKFVWKGQ